MEHHATRQLPNPTMAPQVGGQLFGVQLLIIFWLQILILKQNLTFKISHETMWDDHRDA